MKIEETEFVKSTNTYLERTLKNTNKSIFRKFFISYAIYKYYYRRVEARKRGKILWQIIFHMKGV